MAIQHIAQVDSPALRRFLTDARTLDTAGTSGHDWLRPAREAALARLEAGGLPTPRDEDWRFTNLAPLSATAFRSAGPATKGVRANALAPFVIPDSQGPRLVFVNGRFAPELSTLGGLPAGVRVRGLAEAVATDRDAVEPHLACYESFRGEAFSALNTAFLSDGAFVSVARGAVAEAPIHLLYVAVPDGAPVAVHPRTLIITGEGSQAAIVEDYVSLGQVTD